MNVTDAASTTRAYQGFAGGDLSRLRETAHRVAGSVFYGTLLKAMRESSLKGTYGHGGRGEEVFAGQLHGLWAEKLGLASGKGMGDVLYRHLEAQQRRMSRAWNRPEATE
jgi:Rod binding domain-containing protein